MARAGGPGPAAIVREWKFDDFAAAIAFVDRVAELAEGANHHPDILLHGWNKVRLTLSTHSEGGLTEADFALAGASTGSPERRCSPRPTSVRLATVTRSTRSMNDDEEPPRSSVGPSARAAYAAEPARSGPSASATASPVSDGCSRVNGLKLILTALLVALNAFFVIAEYALVRSRRARLEVMREEGARGAGLALEQLENVNEYISAVQIGVTMTSIGDRCARRARAGLDLLEEAFCASAQPRRGRGDLRGRWPSLIIATVS